MKSTPNNRYAAYVRVSSAEQTDGYSLDAQEHLVREWVPRQHGELTGDLVTVYRDAGYSARTEDRPAFQEMIADARAGQFDMLVVHKFDRLARDREGSITFKKLLRKKLGIKVFSVTEPSEDSEGSMGMLIEGVLETFAEWYSLNLAAEVRKGKRQKAEQGLWHGAVPTGYCNGKCRDCKDPNGAGYCPHAGHGDKGDGKVLIPHPIESKAIQLAFQWYRRGDWSDRDIAHKLNEARFETPDGQQVPFRTKFHKRKDSQPGPGPFTKDTMKDILTRPFYAGQVEYYGADPSTGERRKTPLFVRQGQHEPLISLDLFQHCQDLRRSKGKAANSRTKNCTTAVYPLAGILICNECGAPLRSHRNGSTRYYRCRTRIQRKDGCSQTSVRADAVEPVVDELMASLVLPPELRKHTMAYLMRDESLDTLETRKRDLQARFDRVQELYFAGDIDRGRYDQERAECTQALGQLQPQSRADTDLILPLLNDFEAIWLATTPLERKGLLATVFREIRVHDGQIVELEAAPPFDGLLSLAGAPVFNDPQLLS